MLWDVSLGWFLCWVFCCDDLKMLGLCRCVALRCCEVGLVDFGLGWHRCGYV